MCIEARDSKTLTVKPFLLNLITTNYHQAPSSPMNKYAACVISHIPSPNQ